MIRQTTGTAELSPVFGSLICILSDLLFFMCGIHLRKSLRLLIIIWEDDHRFGPRIVLRINRLVSIVNLIGLIICL